MNNWSSASADLLISAGMIWSLRNQKRGFNPNTDSVLTSLMKISFGSAGLTALLSIANT